MFHAEIYCIESFIKGVSTRSACSASICNAMFPHVVHMQCSAFTYSAVIPHVVGLYQSRLYFGDMSLHIIGQSNIE